MPYRSLQSFFAATMLLCGLGLFLHTFSAEYDAMSDNAGALLYPRFLFFLWILTSVGVLWDSLHLDAKTIKDVEWLRVIMASAIVGLFIFLFSVVGFVIASSLFFSLFAIFLGARNFALVIGLAVVYSYGINYIFTQLLQISLPALGD